MLKYLGLETRPLRCDKLLIIVTICHHIRLRLILGQLATAQDFLFFKDGSWFACEQY